LTVTEGLSRLDDPTEIVPTNESKYKSRSFKDKKKNQDKKNKKKKVKTRCGYLAADFPEKADEHLNKQTNLKVQNFKKI
jgi:hypothetical protein